ncbi:ribosomal protein L25, Ctc-form [Sphaerochaeta pleomorpha str. Grapes]|uniref:Large ribosomal subunit protein bL25 n=1 Tax=Sphaerochaeta pleomorpha (strain ATCC BAA-1885 / DSM 22778 / Grapes) TaxID=158190 RepID=G8QYC1_SPHPG|nr:50S ribosomal protein L25 [Sphaerochaeta pleomorpha]AEV30768.1 ribosomal protein L25, Ctc-form [Sphaerochaeta pleomorpha str. Grapes]
MVDSKKLTASERTTDFGSAGSRRLLRQGFIPAVIYGKNAPVHIVLNAKEFTMKLRHFSETALLEITVGKKKYECLMKAYQENLMKGQIKHVDFYEVTRGHLLRTKVTLTLEGNPIGTREGGVLDQVVYEIEIECMPKDLPQTITANVSGLKLNQVLHLKDIALPLGVKLLEDVSMTVASVKSVKEEVVAAAAVEEVVAAAAPVAPEAKAKK